MGISRQGGEQMNSGLDSRYFFPEVFQAMAGENYTVYAYLNDGSIRKVDIAPFLEAGNRDEYKCIDIDPFFVFESPIVSDFPENI